MVAVSTAMRTILRAPVVVWCGRRVWCPAAFLCILYTSNDFNGADRARIHGRRL